MMEIEIPFNEQNVQQQVKIQKTMRIPRKVLNKINDIIKKLDDENEELNRRGKHFSDLYHEEYQKNKNHRQYQFELTIRHSQLKNEFQAFQTQTQNKENEFISTIKQKNKLIKTLEIKKDQMFEQIRSTDFNNRQLRHQMKGLEEKIILLSEKNTKPDPKIEECRVFTEQLLEKNKNLNEAYEDLQKDIQEKLRLIEELQNKLQQSDNQHEIDLKTMERLEAANQSHQKTIKSYEDEMLQHNLYQQKKPTLIQQIGDLEKIKEDQEERLKQQSEYVDELDKRLESVYIMCEEADKKNEQQEQEIKALEKQKNELELDKEFKEYEITDLKTKIQGLEEKISTNNGSMQELQNIIQNNEIKIKQQDQEISSQQKCMESKELDIKTLVSDHQKELDSIVIEWEDQVQCLKDLIDLLRQQLNSAIKEHQQKKIQYEQEKQDQQTLENKLKQDITEISIQMTQKDNDHSQGLLNSQQKVEKIQKEFEEYAKKSELKIRNLRNEIEKTTLEILNMSNDQSSENRDKNTIQEQEKTVQILKIQIEELNEALFIKEQSIENLKKEFEQQSQKQRQFIEKQQCQIKEQDVKLMVQMKAQNFFQEQNHFKSSLDDKQSQAYKNLENQFSQYQENAQKTIQELRSQIEEFRLQIQNSLDN